MPKDLEMWENENIKITTITRDDREQQWFSNDHDHDVAARRHDWKYLLPFYSVYVKYHTHKYVRQDTKLANERGGISYIINVANNVFND